MINRPLALKGTNIIRNNDEYIIGKVIKNTNIEDDPSKYIQVLDDENIEKYQECCKGYIFENKPKNIDLTDINYGYNIKNFETLINYDVIEMLGNGVIRVLYRDDSDDNAIVVTNQCNSNCIMCPDSDAVRNTKENPNIKKILEQIECIPDDTEHITITGGEVGILKGDFIKVLEKCKECLQNTEFLVLTNGRVFSVKEYTEKIAEVVPNNVRFAIPIYAGEPKLHDEITRVPGSFKQAIAGIHNLMNKNIDIEIRIVVLKKNYKELENIAKFIVKNMPQVKMVNIMALEMTGNAFKNKDQVWINFTDESDYLYKACMRLIANGIVTNLYNFPLCCIDERLYSISRTSITDYKVRYKEQCEECDAQDCCGGFFSSTINIKDITIKPIKS